VSGHELLDPEITCSVTLRSGKFKLKSGINRFLPTRCPPFIPF
jgi:hypothetical protein